MTRSNYELKLTRREACGAVVGVLIGAKGTVAATTVTAPSPGAWPVFRGNPQSTGVATGSLPEKLELLWKVTFPDGGFESTVAIADGVVYAPSFDGKLYALSLADGNQKWKFDGDLTGFSAAAAVRDGRIYIGDVSGKFYCVGADGQSVWNFDAKAPIDGGANFYKDKVLVGSEDATLYCRSAVDGTPAWEFTIDNQIRCCPTVVDNLAFLAGCDERLHMIDLDKGEEVRSVPIEAPTGCTPAVVGDFLYVGTYGEVFFGIDWREASVAWTYKGQKRGGEIRSSAAAAEDIVVFGGRDRLVHALNPQSGDVLWTFPTRSAVDGSPVIVGERVFIGSGDGRLYALDRKTGAKLWEYESGGRFTASPAVAAGRLVIGNDSGDLLCFGAKE